VTDLIETLPQALLGRRPFTPTNLPIPPQRYYHAQLVYLRAFGVGVWLLMGGGAHGLLRLSGHDADLRRVLDVVGVGMLVPMPPLWAADVLMLATNTFRLPGLAITHAVVQLWETALFAVGLHTVLRVPWALAVLAGAAASGCTSFWAPRSFGERAPTSTNRDSTPACSAGCLSLTVGSSSLPGTHPLAPDLASDLGKRRFAQHAATAADRGEVPASTPGGPTSPHHPGHGRIIRPPVVTYCVARVRLTASHCEGRDLGARRRSLHRPEVARRRQDSCTVAPNCRADSLEHRGEMDQGWPTRN
jgi:hypothetical protein